MRIMFAIFI